MRLEEPELSNHTRAAAGISVKVIAIGVCSIVLLLALRGGGNPYVGTWNLDIKRVGPEIDRQLQAKGLPSLGITPGKMPGFLTSTLGFSNSRLELRSDKTYTMKFSMPIGEKSQTGKWTVQNDALYLKPDQMGKPPIDGRRDGRRLFLKLNVGFPLGVAEVPYKR